MPKIKAFMSIASRLALLRLWVIVKTCTVDCKFFVYQRIFFSIDLIQPDRGTLFSDALILQFVLCMKLVTFYTQVNVHVSLNALGALETSILLLVG